MKLLTHLRLLIFVLISALFVSCTDEVISGMGQETPIVVDTDLSPAKNLKVTTGMTDSVSMVMLYFSANPEAPELNKFTNPDGFLSETEQRVKKFVLSWDRSDNADWYEVRVFEKPINDTNWALAKPVNFIALPSENGKMIAEVALDPRPQISSGKCINCAACVTACPFGAITTQNGKSVVDADKCVGCGECWNSCKYGALNGLLPGNSYFFAVRATNSNGDVSAQMSATSDAYELRYTTMAAIPNSEKPEKWNEKGKSGCYGNCGIRYDENGDCEHGICYIVSPPNNIFDPGSHESVCPVDAIYTVQDSSEVAGADSDTGAIFIDLDKCINCGRCVLQCQSDGYGSVTSEIIKSVKAIFGR